MTDLRKAAEMALEALDQYIEKELTFGQRYTNEGQQLLDAHAILRQALEQQECTECNGIGFRDGVGDKCKKCGGEGDEPWDTADMAHRTGGLSMEQEPVTWRNAAIRLGEDLYSVGPNGYYDMTASQWLDWALSVVNTAPPKREWVGLTDEEAVTLVAYHNPLMNKVAIARAVEAKLREKNGF